MLEFLGSLSQAAEKALRLSVAYLKQSLEDKEVYSYGWIEGKDMVVVDLLTNQGLRRDMLDEIII